MELKALTMGERRKKLYAPNPKDTGNRVVHWDSLKKLVGDNTSCKSCGSEIKLTETTVGIATEVQLVCTNKNFNLNKCNFVRRTNTKIMQVKKSSSASFALNVQFVLALMQVGGGNSESETLINFLDLPHGSTFKKSSFSSIQSALISQIVELSDKSMKKALSDEVKSSVSEKLFKEFHNKNNVKEIKLTVSYDTGWNKRSSGHKYDSISGHGFVMGAIGKKILNHR